jgi:hypothetical protein
MKITVGQQPITQIFVLPDGSISIILSVRKQQLFDFSINLNIWHYQE